MTVGTMVTVGPQELTIAGAGERVTTIQGSRVTLLIQLLSPYSPLHPIPWYSVPLEHQSYSFVSFDAFTGTENSTLQDVYIL